MIPVDQTTFARWTPGGAHELTGNCVQAAIASILELPLEEVPHFGAIPGSNWEWWTAVQGWMAGRGWFVLHLEVGLSLIKWVPAYALASGKSPRGDFLHTVVWRAGEVAHDPHPSRDGIDSLIDIWFLIPLDPSKVIARPQ